MKNNKLNKNEQTLFDACTTAGAIQPMVDAMVKTQKGRHEIERVAQALKLTGIADDIKPSDNRALAVLKTQVSRASDTHSLQGLGEKQTATVAMKKTSKGGKAESDAKADTGEGIEPTGKGKAKTMTKEDVWDFVATYFTKDELDALVLDWATRHTDTKKVA